MQLCHLEENERTYFLCKKALVSRKIDNLITHKVNSARKAIKTKDAILIYLLLDLLDLNPIEKLKSPLRKAAARIFNFLWDSIAQAIDLISIKIARIFSQHDTSWNR
ncbi:MAG: hypothetical protein ACTXOO_05840 [Sodalis sp. (in: enterobacteria)]